MAVNDVHETFGNLNHDATCLIGGIPRVCLRCALVKLGEAQRHRSLDGQYSCVLVGTSYRCQPHSNNNCRPTSQMICGQVTSTGYHSALASVSTYKGHGCKETNLRSIYPINVNPDLPDLLAGTITNFALICEGGVCDPVVHRNLEWLFMSQSRNEGSQQRRDSDCKWSVDCFASFYARMQLLTWV